MNCKGEVEIVKYSKFKMDAKKMVYDLIIVL